MTECFVLLKWYQGRETDATDVTVHSVHLTEQSVMDRVARIATANKQYPMRRIGTDSWVVGPTEDEGFFGNSPVHLRMLRSKMLMPQPSGASA